MKTFILIAVSILSLSTSAQHHNVTTAPPNNNTNSTELNENLEKLFINEINDFEYNESILNSITNNLENHPYIAAIESITVNKLVPPFKTNFNTSDYLPKNFNPLKGMHDLDWSKIVLVELEETIDFSFNTKDYLPLHFNASEDINKLTTSATLVAIK